MAIFFRGLDGIDFDTDGEGERTISASYKLFADAPPSVIGEQQILIAAVASTGIDIGVSWLSDAGAVCNGMKATAVKSSKGIPARWEWRADFKFSSKSEDNNPSGGGGGPSKEKDKTLRPMTVNVSVEKYEQAAPIDIYGNFVRNSAGDPVTRTKKMSRVIFKYSKHMRVWNWKNNQRAAGFVFNGNIPLEDENLTEGSESYRYGFLYSRNKLPFNPSASLTSLFGGSFVDPGAARIEDMRCEVVYDTPKPCVKVDIEVRVDNDFFYDKFLDAGYYHFVSANPYTAWDGTLEQPDLPVAANPFRERRLFRDKNGSPATREQLLDGAGNPLAANEVPFTNKYQYYCERDWTVAPMGGPSGFFS